MTANSYLHEINIIDAELKRLNLITKNLRLQKKRQLVGLCHYMKSNNIEKVGEGKNAITLKKCENATLQGQPRPKLKPKKIRKIDELNLLREVGIPDPINFYAQLEKTRTAKLVLDNNENCYNKTSNRGRSKKTSYDALLGF